MNAETTFKVSVLAIVAIIFLVAWASNKQIEEDRKSCNDIGGIYLGGSQTCVIK